MTGAPASRSGSRPMGGAAKASPASPSIPSAGDWVLTRETDWSGVPRFIAGRVEKITPKQVKVRTWRLQTLALSAIAAVLPDEATARDVQQKLDGLRGTWREKNDAADDEARVRKARNAEKGEAHAARIIASAIEARSDATGTGAAEGESATRQGDAQ